MFLERTPIRIEVTIGISILIHLALVGWLGMQKSHVKVKPQLKEVEFIEQIEEPNEAQKLMKQLATRPADSGRSAQIAQQAEAQLSAQSFSNVVGLERTLSDSGPIDVTKLADIPEPELEPIAEQTIKPKVASPTIKLAKQQSSQKIKLESQVVALTDLPAADFDLDIHRNQFQQPEQIIKEVKAARRHQQTDIKKKMSINQASFIQGPVKNRGIIRRQTPESPRWLEEKGIEAEVVIRFAVDPDGSVNHRMIVEKTSGYAELDQLAMDALKKFIFEPLPLTAKQVEENGTITFRFTFLR